MRIFLISETSFSALPLSHTTKLLRNHLQNEKVSDASTSFLNISMAESNACTKEETASETPLITPWNVTRKFLEIDER